MIYFSHTHIEKEIIKRIGGRDEEEGEKSTLT